MLNLVGNTCIPSWITTKCLNQGLVNPFTWCMMSFESCYNLVKYFDTINFGRFKLKTDNFDNFRIVVDDLVEIHYVHYQFDMYATSIKKVGVDVFYNRIWEFIVEKYIERSRRMFAYGCPPTFIFACANGRRGADYDRGINLVFTPEQQKAIYDLKSPYRIFMSYDTLYPHVDAIHQDTRFSDNGMPISTYIYKCIKHKL